MSIKPVHTFTIIPKLPPSLERLRDLAYNLRWSWNHETIALFRRLDSDLWEACGHNPVRMLGALDQNRLEEAAANESFVAHLERVLEGFDGYLQSKTTWFRKTHGNTHNPLIAYFSAEFGLTECISIFAGGLGILAGDHLKSSSDLGVPIIGVGLLYQQGYFRQYLNAAGWQQEAMEDNDFHSIPATLLREQDGKPKTIDISYPDKKVFAQIWRLQAGRVSLYLLDTNISENARSEDRDITDQLYGGDLENRIRQEILLGIGGCKMLEALDIHPTVYHMNEGHSAFLSLELIRNYMEKHSLTYAEARELASASLVFTTHTPVTAGHDYFPPDMMDHYFAAFIPKLGIDRKRFLALGRRNSDDEKESFCMTTLALRMASFSNGVSRLHGQISRQMWHDLWPGVPEDEIPILHISNGVHFQSWISQEMEQLYERYLGPSWREQPAEQSVWRRVESIAAEELWHTHARRRERLVAFTRKRLRSQLQQRGASQAELKSIEDALDPDALTIGFARRFATYKRATLLIRDKNRLASILNDAKRPVQIIFAGKAHPLDDSGKALIQQITALAREPQFRHRMVFLEDYDVSVARYLVQGVDVWLNTPLRPNEASGTSGMKALANGAINLSILDGWWDEAYLDHATDASPVGWAIGRGESYADREYQDQVEAEALYDILERDVIPTFYDRSADGLPRRWVSLMMSSIGTLCPRYNTNRMIREYTEKFYLPAHADHESLAADGNAQAKAHAALKKRIRSEWSNVRIEMIDTQILPEIHAGETVRFSARVYMGNLTLEDLRIELYAGPLNAQGEIVRPIITEMPFIRKEDGAHIFELKAIPCCGSGQHGFTVRVVPRHPDEKHPFAIGLIAWAG